MRVIMMADFSMSLAVLFFILGMTSTGSAVPATSPTDPDADAASQLPHLPTDTEDATEVGRREANCNSTELGQKCNSMETDRVGAHWVTKVHVPVYMSCTCLSLVTCLVAFTVYFIVRDVKEVRNQPRHWINWHFLFSFILRDTMNLSSMVMQLLPNYSVYVRTVPWKVLAVYALIPNFFWMFVEGLYLYIGVFHAFGNKIYTWQIKVGMFIIGWVIPACLTSIWCLQQYITKGSFLFGKPFIIGILSPIYLVLFLNLIMMTRVCYTLFTKLKTSQTEVNLRKIELKMNIAKRLAVFTLAASILLGVPQIIPMILLQIVDHTSKISYIVNFVNSIWSALQGFFVPIFYVLMNKDVMDHMRRRLSSTTMTVSSNITEAWEEAKRRVSSLVEKQITPDLPPPTPV